MDDVPLTWITAHRIRVATPVDARDVHIPGPAGASLTLIGPEMRLDAGGLPLSTHDAWGGIAFYADRAAAEAALDAPETLPGCNRVVEAWHGLLCPTAHRGETNWFGALEDARRFQPAGFGADPGGRLMVVTSAGFNSRTGKDIMTPEQIAADVPRRIDFLRNVDNVVRWYRTLPTNMASTVFVLGRHDGMTFSVWESDAAMAEAAYKSGIHRTQLDRYKTEQTADRTSFTRTRLLRVKGTWDGATLLAPPR